VRFYTLLVIGHGELYLMHD